MHITSDINFRFMYIVSVLHPHNLKLTFPFGISWMPNKPQMSFVFVNILPCQAKGSEHFVGLLILAIVALILVYVQGQQDLPVRQQPTTVLAELTDKKCVLSQQTQNAALYIQGASRAVLILFA